MDEWTLVSKAKLCYDDFATANLLLDWMRVKMCLQFEKALMTDMAKLTVLKVNIHPDSVRRHQNITKGCPKVNGQN